MKVILFCIYILSISSAYAEEQKSLFDEAPKETSQSPVDRLRAEQMKKPQTEKEWSIEDVKAMIDASRATRLICRENHDHSSGAIYHDPALLEVTNARDMINHLVNPDKDPKVRLLIDQSDEVEVDAYEDERDEAIEEERRMNMPVEVEQRRKLALEAGGFEFRENKLKYKHSWRGKNGKGHGKIGCEARYSVSKAKCKIEWRW